MTLNMMLDNAAPEAIAGALTQQHPGLFFTMVEQASVAISSPMPAPGSFTPTRRFAARPAIHWRNC
ncbi:hypothetical protein LNO81_19455 [Klebsiella variicola subsp. variicola]|nr:hypothetical protein [Klebsiella variicola subsp. variicola]